MGTTGDESSAGVAGAVRAEWAQAPRTIRVLVVLQILVVVAVGVVVAKEYPPWSLDEGAHYDYVSYVADEARLPVLGVDPIHDEVVAIARDEYPGPSSVPDPPGILGESYEAFQPPLYYILVAPAWHTTSNHESKIRSIRAVGLVFLVLTVLVLAALARAVVGREWPTALAFAMLVFLVPGVLLRSVTVGNAALEPLVATAFVWCTVMAWKRESYRWLVAAGAVLGTCLLTRLVLGYLVPVLIVVGIAVWWRRGRAARELAWVASAFVVPVLLVAPWLAFNLHHHDALTAGELARKMQEPIINPDRVDYSVGDALGALPGITRFGVPQEWATFMIDHPLPAYALDGLRFLFIPFALVLLAVLGRRALRGWGSVICLAVLPLAVAALAFSTVVSDWPQMLSRYTFGALPAFAVGVYCIYRALLPRERDFTVFVMILSAITVVVLVMLTSSALVDDTWTGI